MGRPKNSNRAQLLDEAPPAGANFLQQQAKFDAFMAEFNNERPHEALGMKMPAEAYARSPDNASASRKSTTASGW